MPVDENGNQMLYPSSSTNPQNFTLPMTRTLILNRQSQLDSRIYLQNSFLARLDTDNETVDYWEFDVSNVQAHFLTDAGMPSSGDCSKSQTELLQQGYIYSPKDWKNVEITCWFQVLDVTNENNYISFIVRSGWHHNNQRCCVGTGYWSNFYWSSYNTTNAGYVSVHKEEWHESLYEKGKRKQSLFLSFRNVWVGVKTVIWTSNKTGVNKVIIKQYVCPNYEQRHNTWNEVNHVEDYVGANWSSKGLECNAPTADQPIFWGGHFVTMNWTGGNTVHIRDLSIREIEPDLEWGSDPTPPSGTPVADIDNNGIQWMVAKGNQYVIDQSRNQSNDDRWSDNFNNMGGGYEATVIAEFGNVDNDGHIALKMWGGNHCGDCQYEEDNECCCWYDIGIREDGDVQTEIERPHPSNDSFTPAAGELKMSNIGSSMSGETIGLKWLIYPTIYPNGHVGNGGIHIKMWRCLDALLPNGDPRNDWVLVLDMLDTGSVMDDYIVPDEQEIEMRNSDTSSQTMYAGGLHVRRLRRGQNGEPDDLTLPPSGGGGGSGGGSGGGDTGGGTGGGGGSGGGGSGGSGGGGTEPPALPASFKKIVKFRRNIINNFLCKCIGQTGDAGGGDGGGGGSGGSGNLITPYHVTMKGVSKSRDYHKLGSVSGRDDFYLIYSQKVMRTSSKIYDFILLIIEVFIAEEDKPRGGTGGGVHVVIRYRSDHPSTPNQIAVDFGYIDEHDIHDAGSWFIIKKLDNTYALQVGDRICFEYDGGDKNDYVKIFYQDNAPKTGSKVSRRSNKMAFGEWEDRNIDIVMTLKGYYK